MGQVVLAQQPKIAWTGVPGHTGTNSVITIANAAGDVLFWYQSGAGWAQETAAAPAQGVGYGAPDLTATSTGIVIAPSVGPYRRPQPRQTPMTPP